jgi:transcriptional regulator with XRE-family HTH domain
MERGTRAKWAARVRQWRSSGLTASEFAQKVGINAATLRWWSSRLKTRPSDEGGVVSPLTFVEMAGAVGRDPIEVVLGSGIRLLIPVDFDAAAVGRLLDVLAERR